MVIPRWETFIPHPKWSGVVRALQAKINESEFDDPAEKHLTAFWKAKQDEIRQIVHRAEALGQHLQNASLDLVLCHADIHTANLMHDQDHKMFVVDWDNPVMAPKERDLMFVVGAVVGGLVIGDKLATD